ncbi:MAG: glycosyltransferase family 4 protein [Planctomycetia bacterium]|jgi:glycosyltransferase involved in cell wall biosynthesis
MATLLEYDRQPQAPTRPINVCFVIDNLSRAGTELQLLKLIKHIDREKVVPHLFLLDGKQSHSRALQPDDLPVLSLGVHRLCSYRAARAARQFRAYLKKHAIDVVQTYFVDSTRFAAPIAKSVGCTVFGARRNLGHALGKVDRKIARLYNRHFIDKIIVNSEAARRSVIEQERANSDDVIVIHNGVELEPFQNTMSWSSMPESAIKNVGMIGNLREVKGIDLFILAAKKVLDRHPNTLFQIAGTGETEKYQAMIDHLGLTGRIQLLGSVEMIPNFLAMLDVAVLPSRAEGLSNALLEYMAAGRPIVATCVGGNPELIQHEWTGLLAEPENAESIAENITELLKNSFLAEQLATRAQQAITERFAIETIARQHEEVYTAQATKNQ